MEHWDLAQQHFEDALTANERWGIRPAIARTRAEYAAMLLRRDRPGDRGKAHDLATIALDEAESMKMLPLAEKTRALLGRQRFPSGLTRREVEVIRLIARGNTNPEIADALVITVNTVRRHVTHILEKTGNRQPYGGGELRGSRGSQRQVSACQSHSCVISGSRLLQENFPSSADGCEPRRRHSECAQRKTWSTCRGAPPSPTYPRAHTFRRRSPGSAARAPPSSP